MQVRFVVEDGARRQLFHMRASQMRIGRRRDCGLRIPSEMVSREHCQISLLKGFLTVQDLGSANGTYLNEVQVLEEQPVRPGDRLRVGPVTFVVEYEMDAAALRRLRQWEQKQQAPPVHLDILDVELIDEDSHPRRSSSSAIPLDASDSDLALPVLDEDEDLPAVFDEELPFLPVDEPLGDFLAELDKLSPEDLD